MKVTVYTPVGPQRVDLEQLPAFLAAAGSMWPGFLFAVDPAPLRDREQVDA